MGLTKQEVKGILFCFHALFLSTFMIMRHLDIGMIPERTQHCTAWALYRLECSHPQLTLHWGSPVSLISLAGDWGTKMQNKRAKGTWVRVALIMGSWGMQKAKLQPYMLCMWKQGETCLRDGPKQPSCPAGNCGCGGKMGIYLSVLSLLHSGRCIVSGYHGVFFFADVVAWNQQKTVRLWCFLFWKTIKTIILMKT